ncbi:Site-2 protease family protein [Gammaproteobacteria bacterium]
MDNLNIVQQFAIWVLPVLFGVTLHEVAHGWMANRLGDPTALMLGRLSFNPIKHIDPVGTIAVPATLLIISSIAGTPLFIFGWAKPVPVTFENLRQPKRDMALVAIAGPLANLLMALLWGVLIKFGYPLLGEETSWVGEPMVFMGLAGIGINSALMVLNLLPLPPLDGGRILIGLLPASFTRWLVRSEPYGILILLLLLTSGILGWVMNPLVALVQYAVISMLRL